MIGYNIVIHDKPIGRIQFRFPKTKKWRIRKKWAKREENFKNKFLEKPLVYENGTIICTSRMAQQIRRHLAAQH